MWRRNRDLDLDISMGCGCLRGRFIDFRFWSKCDSSSWSLQIPALAVPVIHNGCVGISTPAAAQPLMVITPGLTKQSVTSYSHVTQDALTGNKALDVLNKLIMVLTRYYNRRFCHANDILNL
ncbi:hypothetical protein RRG08_038694 [Elysia crispata]|uniref:Uncharacterized protein n=1 Tax=Elysia crispata TaxID=231223 RepID=A0AAE0ZIQ1_9GAST|nr:hypothetical protein RRG08_038694 [Elysia crispata]